MIWLVLVLGSIGAGWLFGHGDASDNAFAASASAPVHLLTAALGVTFGLYGRDRIRLRRTYASPTLAYLGKALFFVSLSPAAAWILSPVAWPMSSLHLSAGGCALGAALWLGNLPTRL
jgi:hypothetical protein